MMRTLLAILTATTVLLAGCGGGDDARGTDDGGVAGPADVTSEDVAAESTGYPCATVDPRSLRTRFDDIEPTVRPDDDSCIITVEGTDVATVTVTPFDRAAFDAGVADLADAPDTGIEGAQGKVGEDRAVIGIGDHLVVAERLPEGVHGPNRWISAIVRSVQDG